MLALYAQAIASAEALACDALLLRVLARAAGGRRAAAAPSAPSAIRHARARIDDDPAASLSLADLAAACGLSRYQTLRAFARDTGMTPHAYQVQRRLLLARGWIRAGATLADAAAAGGFSTRAT